MKKQVGWLGVDNLWAKVDAAYGSYYEQASKPAVVSATAGDVDMSPSSKKMDWQGSAAISEATAFAPSSSVKSEDVDMTSKAATSLTRAQRHARFESDLHKNVLEKLLDV